MDRMCQNCDYAKLLESADLEVTPNRLQVLEVVGASSCPLSANDIFAVLERSQPINKVTVYRILDLMVERHLLDRLSTGGRAAYYGLAPNEHHAPHAHFYCSRCGQMDCLQPEALQVDTGYLRRTFPGQIERLEIRIDGICKNCLRQS